MVDYSQYIAALDDSPFEETPVDLETFLGPDYLGEHFVLSEIQTDMVQCMSQIYKLDDLIRLYGVEEGTYIYKKYTKKEVIFELGKGAGKDFSSTVGCAYLVYKLLCLKDPAVYFGKVPGDAIDIINIAINAEQAKNVFFKGFLNRIKRSPWFKGRYQEYSNYVAFDKEITVYSGHSERESAEGLNLILAILDEISGFNMNNNSGNQNAKTSQAIYDAFRGSVDSRFPDYGKCLTGDSLVWTNDGLKKVYDVVNNPGMVMSGKNNMRQVTGVYDDGIRNGLKITNDRGISLDVTQGHKLYVRSMNGFEGWKLAKDINQDDFVAINLNGSFGHNDVSEQDAYALGVWVAEGSATQLDKKYNRQSIVMGADNNLMQLVLAAMTDWRDRFTSKKCNQKPVKIVKRDDNFSYICIRGTDLKDNFYKEFGIESKNFATKHVPRCIMEAPENIVASFLRGLFDGDGYCCFKPEIGTGSQRLASEISALMFGMGIDNRIRVKITASGNPSYVVTAIDVNAFKKIGFSDPTSKKYRGFQKALCRYNGDIRYLPGCIDDLEDIAKWLDNQPGGRSAYNCARIGRNISGARMLTYDQAMQYVNNVPEDIGASLRHKINDNIIWSRVVDISESTDHRYDFEVDMDHSFIANSIINHNCALLSFPRYKGDFISSHYDEMVTEKYVEKREHTFVIDNDLPPTPDNTFKIEWDHDVITKYKIPGKIYAVKACSWEANPGRDVEDYKDAFLVNPADAYQRFACMPEGIEGGLFKNLDALQSTMMLTNPISSNQVLNASWKPDPEITYYLHADLAQKQDRCAVAMAHVDKFIKMGVYGGNEWIAPHVTVDFVVWWDNKPTDPLDLSVVAEWVIGLKRRGINIGMVTTDRWNSVDFQKQLRSVGIKTDTLSVARREYDDMVLTVYDDRVMMPALDILFSELSQLRIINDKKVDHPRSGGKDLADATCGAIHNAIAYTSQYDIAEVDIHDYTAVRSNRLHEEKENEKPAMPQDIADFLSGIGAL